VAASRLLSAMDQSIDPCEDFFEYACGTWNRAHIIPDDKSSYNTFRKLGDELQTTLKGRRPSTNACLTHCLISQIPLRYPGRICDQVCDQVARSCSELEFGLPRTI